jgi:NADH:ubiquinone oxidoreductase subunit 3 (subunit A)
MSAFGAALAVAVATGIAVLTSQWLRVALDPAALTAPERTPFLGGGQSQVHAWSRFHVRYYAMALLFLAFDMEMVFMYPWAVVFVEEGALALIEMLMFIVILLLGILYAWREGALEWA